MLSISQQCPFNLGNYSPVTEVKMFRTQLCPQYRFRIVLVFRHCMMVLYFGLIFWIKKNVEMATIILAYVGSPGDIHVWGFCP